MAQTLHYVLTNSNVNFSNKVNGNFGLTIAAGSGNVGFAGSVGTIAALTSLSSSGTGAVIFSSAVGSSTQRLGSVNITGTTVMNGSNIYTSGNQLFNGAVTLGVDTLLNASAGTVGFISTVDSATNTTPESLTVTASGLTSFNGCSRFYSCDK